MIDLRSDTLTLPTEEMRKAIYAAELGDDGRINDQGQGEDPTVNILQRRAAEMFGKEDALLVSSGTMGNWVSLLSYCEPGDKVIVGENSHIYQTERTGFDPRFGGAVPSIVAYDAYGRIQLNSLTAEIDKGGITLLCLENTNNFCGGTVSSKTEMRQYVDAAHGKGVPVHLDGARIFNAAIAQKADVKSLTEGVDSIMFCLSKGLSCPIGSVVVGTRDFIREARKHRRNIGGQMRQAGIAAAAGIVALDGMIERMEEDHINARRLAEFLMEVKKVSLNLNSVQTNMVRLDISATGITASQFTQELTRKGVKLQPGKESFVRCVIYRGISARDVEEAARIIGDYCRDL